MIAFSSSESNIQRDIGIYNQCHVSGCINKKYTSRTIFCLEGHVRLTYDTFATVLCNKYRVSDITPHVFPQKFTSLFLAYFKLIHPLHLSLPYHFQPFSLYPISPSSSNILSQHLFHLHFYIWHLLHLAGCFFVEKEL